MIDIGCGSVKQKPAAVGIDRVGAPVSTWSPTSRDAVPVATASVDYVSPTTFRAATWTGFPGADDGR